MPKIIFNYNIKGRFELEVPTNNLVEDSIEKINLKKFRKELKENLIYELSGPLIRKPESVGFKADFKITKLVPVVELKGEKSE